jgi:hypothetical protein
VTPDSDFWFYGFHDGSIAFEGDHIVLGTHRESRMGAQYTESCYIYKRNGTTWEFEQKVIAADGQAQDNFGHDVAVSGTTIVVGTYDKNGLDLKKGSAISSTAPRTTRYRDYFCRSVLTAKRQNSVKRPDRDGN